MVSENGKQKSPQYLKIFHGIKWFTNSMGQEVELEYVGNNRSTHVSSAVWRTSKKKHVFCNRMHGLGTQELCNAKKSLVLGNVTYSQWVPKKHRSNLMIID